MKPENISIRVLGAAGTVTGSKFLVQTNRKTILVDCGLFQGPQELRRLNWEELKVDPAHIDLILLTHGHLDHVGYLPRVVRAGYQGEIWGTLPTIEVAKVILEDSARIQVEEAEKANEKIRSKQKKEKPLYNMADVLNTFPLFKAQQQDQWIKIDETISCRFRYNSHIIGATFIEFRFGQKFMVFSGDIGRDDDPLLFSSQKPERADILFIESTYGDQLHPRNVEAELETIIHNAIEKGGTIIIPSFAVERTQSLMHLLWQLRIKKRIPRIPVYMDSPMGTSVLDIFSHNTYWHRLTKEAHEEMCKDIIVVKTAEETGKLLNNREPKIVIAGGGMVSGGRVISYLKKYLPDPASTIMFAGHQAEGTRGKLLLEGAGVVLIDETYVLVKASIRNLQGLSAHADQNDLLNWMSYIKNKPEHVYIVHGESKAAKALQIKIKERFGWDSEIPKMNQTILLS